jgi:hypothetical protein
MVKLHFRESDRCPTKIVTDSRRSFKMKQKNFGSRTDAGSILRQRAMHCQVLFYASLSLHLLKLTDKSTSKEYAGYSLWLNSICAAFGLDDCMALEACRSNLISREFKAFMPI